MNLNDKILESPQGITLDFCNWIDDVFRWQKSIPGDGEKNHERYLQMSGWQDIKDFLRAIAMAQLRGEFKRDRTGMEDQGILSRIKTGGNPILENMLKTRQGG